MKYSRFIHDTLSGKNGICWDYYHRITDTQTILDEHDAEVFIQNYFKDGAKYL